MRKIYAAILYTFLILIAAAIVMMLIINAYASPTEISILSNTTETASGYDVSNSSAEGGTITTITFNATMITSSWKGYVGNITGNMALRDSSNYSLYDWNFASITGEVYASRASSITWADINCTNTSMIDTEETALGITSSAIDSIGNTFNETTHKSFYISSTMIPASNCPAIATNVNGTVQQASESAYFQEVLLDDDSSIVYATLLEPDTTGFDNQTYDFQMIVADSYSDSTATTYYFWAELG